jgi:hypothetical protein
MPPLLIENIVELFRRPRQRPPQATVVDTLRTSTAARWTCARQLRAHTRSMLAHQRASRREASRAIRLALQRHRAAIVASLRRSGGDVDLWRVPDGVADRDDVLRTQVLRSIQAHPDGVAALDVANELGVDWRRVSGAAQTLLQDGTIEQVEQELYPARKVSRT